MTVIDEVLQAEQAAAETIERAKTEATQAVAEAKTQHEGMLQTERDILSQTESVELEKHAKVVEQKAIGITNAVSAEVAQIEKQFTDASADMKAAIKSSLA